MEQMKKSKKIEKLKKKNLIREGLIKAGVKNLKEFGYPGANENNILTDMVYKVFFSKMLEENLGKMLSADKDIKELLKEIG